MSRRSSPSYPPNAAFPGGPELYTRGLNAVCTYLELYSRTLESSTPRHIEFGIPSPPSNSIPSPSESRPSEIDRATEARFQSIEQTLVNLQRRIESSQNEMRRKIVPLSSQSPPDEVEPTIETRLVPVVVPERRIALLDNRSVLISELPEVLETLAGRKWTLLYRGSVHGFRSSDFHEHCDGKGFTLTIVQSLGEHGLKDRLFGGYSPLTWDSSAAYKAEQGPPQSFLFNLNPRSGGPPRKYDLYTAKRGNAIYCHPDYGPTFGSGHDLHICDQCNLGKKSHTACGTAYASSEKDEDKFFHTVQNFRVKEIEVFQITE